MFRKLISLILATLITAVAAPVAKAADVHNLRQDQQMLERAKASSGNAADPGFRSALGLSGNEGLKVIRKSYVGRGGTVTRYRQTYRGVPVWGEQIVIGRDASGKVRSLNGRLVADLAAELQQLAPLLGSEDALQAMKARVTGRFSDKDQVIFKNEQSELVIYLDNGTPRLSQAVSFFADTADGGKPTRPTFIVDAETSEILFEFEGLTHSHCSGCLEEEHNLSSKPKRWKYYELPALDADGILRVELSGGSGDADLYIQKGREPTTADYACQSISPTADETCSVQALDGETWFIGIYAYSRYRGVDLSARLASNATPVAGTGPGGNTKIGQYEYDDDGGEFGNLAVVDMVGDGVCTMDNVNVKTVDLNHALSGSSAYEYACLRNTKKEINGAFSPLNDAHYFGGVVFDMYNAWLGVPPLDFQLAMRVHYSTNYENAFWNGSSMTFGDGNTTFYPLVSLDVAAHEVSHGFTEQNSNLTNSGESGGINESFSDIAGEAAENFSRGTNDFNVGYDIFKAENGALRYMCNPPNDGRSIDHLDDYYGGLDEHYSSGLFNKAFCTLATTSGWSTQTAFQAFALANQSKWTPSTGFAEGAQGVVDAADDLGFDPAAVQAAFDVVGISTVLPGVDNTPPTVSINNAPASVSSTAPFNVTVQFSEDVSGFDINDVSVSNGSASITAVNASTYTATITPDGNGDITIDVAADAAADGAGNGNTAASQVTVAYSSSPPPTGNELHTAPLTGIATPGSRGNKWNVEITIAINDDNGVVDGAVVNGRWSDGANGSPSCTTDALGECQVSKSNLRGASVTFTVTNISGSLPWDNVIESITVGRP